MINYEELVEKYLPGELTIIVDKSEKAKSFLTAGKDTVGFRIPDNIYFQNLCDAVKGHVLATTSANISGEKAKINYNETVLEFKNKVDFILSDNGNNAKGTASTVVQVANNNFTVLRQGLIYL